MTRPSMVRPGSVRAYEPVARTTLRPRTCAVADLHGVLGDEPALALDELDLVRLDQALQTLVQPVDDAVLVRVDPGHVDALERGPDAEPGALAGVVGDLGRVQQRLGRDAAVVQAGAADLVLLDQRDRHAELGGAEGAGVAAAAAAEDHDVELGLRGSCVGHGTLLCMSDVHPAWMSRNDRLDGKGHPVTQRRSMDGSAPSEEVGSGLVAPTPQVGGSSRPGRAGRPTSRSRRPWPT